jgi:hypothetical protein
VDSTANSVAVTTETVLGTGGAISAEGAGGEARLVAATAGVLSVGGDCAVRSAVPFDRTRNKGTVKKIVDATAAADIRTRSHFCARENPLRMVAPAAKTTVNTVSKTAPGELPEQRFTTFFKLWHLAGCAKMHSQRDSLKPIRTSPYLHARATYEVAQSPCLQ